MFSLTCLVFICENISFLLVSTYLEKNHCFGGRAGEKENWPSGNPEVHKTINETHLRIKWDTTATEWHVCDFVHGHAVCWKCVCKGGCLPAPTSSVNFTHGCNSTLDQFKKD